MRTWGIVASKNGQFKILLSIEKLYFHLPHCPHCEGGGAYVLDTLAIIKYDFDQERSVEYMTRTRQYQPVGVLATDTGRRW